MRKLILFLLCLPIVGYSQIDPVNIGTTANDRTGDPLRTAFNKLNKNDAYLDTFGVQRLDSLISAGIGGGSSYTFGNGLTENDGVVGLGGTLNNGVTEISVPADGVLRFKPMTEFFETTGKIQIASPVSDNDFIDISSDGLSLSSGAHYTSSSIRGGLSSPRFKLERATGQVLQLGGFGNSTTGNRIEMSGNTLSSYAQVYEWYSSFNEKFMEFNVNEPSINYVDDYSSYYTDRSLIDKGFADNAYWKTSGTTNIDVASDVDVRRGRTASGNWSFVNGEFFSSNVSEIVFTGASSKDLELRAWGTSGNMGGNINIRHNQLVLSFGLGVSGAYLQFYDKDVSPGINVGDPASVGFHYESDFSTQGFATYGDLWIPHAGWVKSFADDAYLPKSSTASTGTTIAFDVPRTYGYDTAATGNITLNDTGLVEGITQLLIHNDSSEPTFGAEFKVLSGEYVPNVDNYILMHAVKSDLILVTISQEQ